VSGDGVNSTKAVAAAGSATVSIGTAAGSGAASILTAAKASLSADAVIVPTCVATAFKMTAAGKINVTVATGPLTAGVIEVWVLYTTAAT
jgi:G:T/U-mismatch repair DNA glycosylase